jgi:hypothetical protein
MSEYYPRLRIPWKRRPGLAVREGLSLTFYSRWTHRELGPRALRALEVYQQTIRPGALSWYADENGDWQELDERGWTLTRSELVEGNGNVLCLMDTPEGRGEFQFDYYGRWMENPVGVSPEGLVSALSFRLSTEYLEAHGPRHVQGLALALARELPFDSGYVGLCFHAGEGLDVPEAVARHLPRYPGIAIEDLSTTAMYLGTRVEGVYWMNFLGPPVLSELGGVEALRSKLTSPGIIIEPLGEQRACVTLGEWPEAGDTEQGRTLPAYRELARVLEPWLYHRPLSPYTKEFTLSWERRFLD